MKREDKIREEEAGGTYTLLGNAWEEDGTEDQKNISTKIQSLEDYRYFNGFRIRESMAVSKRVAEEGKRLYREGRLKTEEIYSGYDTRNSQKKGVMRVIGTEGKREFPMQIVFTRKDITSFECNCRKCSREYFAQFDVKKTDCPYKAGTLMLLEDYLNTHNIGDSTDVYGQKLLSVFEKK